MKENISILLSIEHDLYRSYIEQRITEDHFGIVVSGSESNFQAISEKHEIDKADVLVLRIDKTIKEPIKFVSDIVHQFSSTKIILIKFEKSLPYFRKFQESGAFIYEMSSPFESLIKLIQEKKS